MADRELTPIAFLDTETTSLDIDREAWDIGIIRRDPDGTEYTVNLIVSDVDLSRANRYSLRIGHFFERHPRFGGTADQGGLVVSRGQTTRATEVDEATAAIDVEAATRGAHIVGAVPNFDVHVLTRLLARHGLPWTAHHHLMDVENLLLGHLAHTYSPDDLAPPWDSEALSRMADIEPPPDELRHTAMGDALWCRSIYDTILGITVRTDTVAAV